MGEKRQTSYAIAGWLFLRLIGVAYLFAFWSLAQQADGLIGHDGILPVRDYMSAVSASADSQHIGWDRIRLVPTLFWLGTSDGFLRALCVSGTVLAGLLVAGRDGPFSWGVLTLRASIFRVEARPAVDSMGGVLAVAIF